MGDITDIYVIENDINELYKALDNIGDGINIIYSNCNSDFEIGNQKVHSKKFDMYLYNEDSKSLIMFVRESKIDKDMVLDILEEKSKPYHEVSFMKTIDKVKDTREIPDIYFVNNHCDLINILKSYYKKQCYFYPLMNGFLNMGFKTTKGMVNKKIDGISFKGVIKLPDKLILLTKSFNMTDDGVIFLFNKYNIKYDLMYESKIFFYKKENKRLNLRKK